MNQKFYMSIKEFSYWTGIKSDNLRFYDKIGLLSPEVRGENKYRYYSRRQLSSAYLITGLRELGLGLDVIKAYSSTRTPETMLILFKEQQKRIQADIERLTNMQDHMKMRIEIAEETLRREDDALYLEEKKKEPIFLGPLLEEHMPDDEAMALSYEYAAEHGINLDYPLGTMVARSNFEAKDFAPISHYYFKAIKNHNDWKPEGLFAVARGCCNCWKSQPIYERLYAFIQEQHLTIVGDVYEEYPLDELAVQDADQFHICLAVRVEENSEK